MDSETTTNIPTLNKTTFWVNMMIATLNADSYPTTPTESDIALSKNHPSNIPAHYFSTPTRLVHLPMQLAASAISETAPPYQNITTSSLLHWSVSDILPTAASNASTNTTFPARTFATLPWQQTCLLAFFSTVIIITVLGNTLIILSVITTRRLRTVTNCFVMSLAVADWMVGIFVMPPSVLVYVYGSWSVGWILCDIWVSMDILLCTASILSLCAISLDRYLAVTQPLHYKKRRTKRLAMIMIFIVWILALAITCPPILGWYEKGRTRCRYNQNKGYVVFSAMGSFFIPMAVMLYVYTRICCVLTSRRSRMTRTEASERTIHDEIEFEANTSDCDSCNHTPKRKYSMRSQQQIFSHHQKSVEKTESHIELVEISKTTSTIRTSSTITNYKFSSVQQFKPIHFCPSQTSLPETYLQGHLHPMHKANRMHRQHQSAAAGLGSYGKRMPIRISSSKRESKAAKTLSMVVGGFIACWLPFFVCYLLIPFLPRESVSETEMSVLTWLGWVNSAINPFIYAFYNSDFRIAFWRLTFRKICKSQPTNRLMLKT